MRMKEQSQSKYRYSFPALLFRALLIAGLAGAGVAEAQAPRSAANVQAELDALVNAAKAEREVVFYTTPTENVAKRVAEAFTSKYGIKASFIRFSSGPLYQR
jgi:hypothetical protein